jgi:hypothetical protein
MDEALKAPLDDILIINEWDGWGHVSDLIRAYLKDCEVEAAYDPNDLPFIVHFESRIREKLIKAGFAIDTLMDKDKMQAIYDVLAEDGLERYEVYPGPLPKGTYTISEDKRVFWVNPDTSAALQAWQAINILKQLLINNDAVKIFLRTFELIISLSRAGEIPAKAIQGFTQSKKQKSNQARRKTWRGKTKQKIANRDKKIREEWKISKLSEHGFAQKQAKEHNISVTQVKNIIRDFS